MLVALIAVRLTPPSPFKALPVLKQGEFSTEFAESLVEVPDHPTVVGDCSEIEALSVFNEVARNEVVSYDRPRRRREVPLTHPYVVRRAVRLSS